MQKGLDFKNVGLVGVVAADVSLHIPDYRSAERTFSAGHAGGGKSGKRRPGGTGCCTVLYAGQLCPRRRRKITITKDFFEKEIAVRRDGLSAFTDLILVEFTSEKEKRCPLRRRKLPEVSSGM